MTKLPGLSDDDVKGRFSTMLRLYVGHGRHIRFEDLASATGDEARCLRSYVESDPPMIPLARALRVLAVLPPDALNMLLAPLGYYAKPLEAEGTCIAQAVSSAAQFVAEGAEALADGTIDHRERARLAEKAAALAPTLSAIAAMGRAQ
ncbi:hypothetical protein [Pedomonas sp. V897]|uniref:hypothetical protein n=1 Tax=Pedomonas sp. V897 TaxID=3446482 RepID=UPI003EDE8B8A